MKTQSLGKFSVALGKCLFLDRQDFLDFFGICFLFWCILAWETPTFRRGSQPKKRFIIECSPASGAASRIGDHMPGVLLCTKGEVRGQGAEQQFFTKRCSHWCFGGGCIWWNVISSCIIRIRANKNEGRTQMLIVEYLRSRSLCGSFVPGDFKSWMSPGAAKQIKLLSFFVWCAVCVCVPFLGSNLNPQIEQSICKPQLPNKN